MPPPDPTLAEVVARWGEQLTRQVGTPDWRMPTFAKDQGRAQLRAQLDYHGVPWTAEARQAMACGVVHALNHGGPLHPGRLAYLLNVCSCLLLDVGESGENLPQQGGQEDPPPSGDRL